MAKHCEIVVKNPNETCFLEILLTLQTHKSNSVKFLSTKNGEYLVFVMDITKKKLLGKAFEKKSTGK